MLTDEQLDLLAQLFTKVLYTGTPPEAWATATVVEIFKGKGSHSDPEMYRPISLLSLQDLRPGHPDPHG